MGRAHETTKFPEHEVDLLIVGGGLAGSLLAQCLSQTRPDLEFFLLESKKQLLGQETWSLHERDWENFEPELQNWIKSHLSAYWPRQEVQFLSFHRLLSSGYGSIRAEDLRQNLKLSSSCVIFQSPVQSVHQDGKTLLLANGRILRAKVILDARGFLFSESFGPCGFQKFVGLDLEMEDYGDLPMHPCIMDAGSRVVQSGGYRFFYLLPFSQRRILIEETLYSKSPQLDLHRSISEIFSYAIKRGAKGLRILRQEQGVLPIPFFPENKNIQSRDSASDKLSIGTQGGFFHSVTGYSCLFAFELAWKLSKLPSWTHLEVKSLLLKYQAERIDPNLKFQGLLNRLLFYASEPHEAYKMLEGFYKLPEDLIARFYSGRMSRWDCARLFLQKPPVSLGRAWRCLPSEEKDFKL